MKDTKISYLYEVFNSDESHVIKCKGREIVDGTYKGYQIRRKDKIINPISFDK